MLVRGITSLLLRVVDQSAHGWFETKLRFAEQEHELSDLGDEPRVPVHERGGMQLEGGVPGEAEEVCERPGGELPVDEPVVRVDLDRLRH
jgi:hypothetical protein